MGASQQPQKPGKHPPVSEPRQDGARVNHPSAPCSQPYPPPGTPPPPMSDGKPWP